MAEALAGLKARVGVLGVLGNHDWWEDGEETQRQLARVGIPLVDNGRMFVTRDRKLVSGGVDGLCVAGVGDLWEGGPDYDAALAGRPAAGAAAAPVAQPGRGRGPPLLRSGHRVDLMLSGHTHGGQVRVPGFGTPMVPSRYGQKYASGLVQGPVCPVFISRGLGTAIMPLRFRVVPEIAVIRASCGGRTNSSAHVAWLQCRITRWPRSCDAPGRAKRRGPVHRRAGVSGSAKATFISLSLVFSVSSAPARALPV